VPRWLEGSGGLFDELTATAPWEQRYRYAFCYLFLTISQPPARQALTASSATSPRAGRGSGRENAGQDD
jgi:hypothetical protein